MKFDSCEEIREVIAFAKMKESHKHWRLQAFISIAMYPAIRSYDDNTFDDMSEESGKKKNLSALSLRNCCDLFNVKALLSRPKKMAN